MARRALSDRFWDKVAIIPFHECWEWVGAVGSGGYGHMRVEGKTPKAHRISYELNVGPIPEGLVLDHLCRNTLCVRPEHLEPVTQRVNVLRGGGVAAVAARKTHCLRGHEYTVENTLVDNWGRHCRACKGTRRGKVGQ